MSSFFWKNCTISLIAASISLITVGSVRQCWAHRYYFTDLWGHIATILLICGPHRYYFTDLFHHISIELQAKCAARTNTTMARLREGTCLEKKKKVAPVLLAVLTFHASIHLQSLQPPKLRFLFHVHFRNKHCNASHSQLTSWCNG